ncbi:MAG: RelA/SpoT domain-containing protein [Clostridia bacterium]|nr:RelA/SpoT domain-containing protein [Clostridia bacterium]
MSKESNIDETKKKMLEEYLNMQLQYVELTEYIKNKVQNLLTENNIKYQNISGRVKSYESLEKKLTENQINGIRRNIMNLNDLSGIRVIFYDENVMNMFLKIIRRNFKDAKVKLPENILKYDGINITVSLGSEISKFNGMFCEIQLTTVISHAMNEFSHNIVYKDVDELESKNLKEYKEIQNILEETRKKGLEIIATFDVLSKRIESIKNGYREIQNILSEQFINSIENVDSINSLEHIINELIDIVPLIVEDEKVIKQIEKSRIIEKIVNKFLELPEETANELIYDMYDYKFNKLLEFLIRYMYVWINNFKPIIGSISRKVNTAERKTLKESFYKFIKECVIADKINSNRKKAKFQIHEKIYEYIMDDKNDTEYELKINMATSFCNFAYNYTEQSKENNVTVVTAQMNPNEIYVSKVENVIKKCCEIFKYNQREDLFNKILNLIRCNDENVEIILENVLYNFINDNYDEIDEYYKNQLYIESDIHKNERLNEYELFKKLKKDKIFKLFSYVSNYFVEDLVGLKYNEKEAKRWEFLNEYINNLDKENIDEIIKLTDLLNKHKKNIKNPLVIPDFFQNLGKRCCFAEQLYKLTKNKHLLLGIIEENNYFQYELENNKEINELLDAMYMAQTTNKILLDKCYDIIIEKNDEEIDKKFIKVICNRIENFEIKKYRNLVILKIIKYNKTKKSIMENVYLIPEVEEFIVKKMNDTQINVIVNNYVFCNWNFGNERLFELVFEKNPEIFRQLIRNRANIRRDLFEHYEYSSLKDIINYKDELKNNLMLSIELIRDHEWYNVDKYVKYLLGEYNFYLEKDMLEIIDKNQDRKIYKWIVEICRILNVSTDGWNVFEKIIENIDEDDKEILCEIDCIIFNTGICCGEYGIANSFKMKEMFFKSLKSKNEKVKKFIEDAKQRYNYMYLDEKKEADKKIIHQEVETQIINRNE